MTPYDKLEEMARELNTDSRIPAKASCALALVQFLGHMKRPPANYEAGIPLTDVEQATYKTSLALINRWLMGEEDLGVVSDPNYQRKPDNGGENEPSKVAV